MILWLKPSTTLQCSHNNQVGNVKTLWNLVWKFFKNNRLCSVDFSNESQDLGGEFATFMDEKYCIFKILDVAATTEHHLVSKFE